MAEFARVFEEQTGHTWVDSALSGSGTGANPVIISRIIGGDPMGATQMNTGRDAEELIQAGLMRDLTPIADELGITDFYVDQSLLEPCTYEGKIYCFPINIHSWDWLWLSTAAYEEIGQPGRLHRVLRGEAHGLPQQALGLLQVVDVAAELSALQIEGDVDRLLQHVRGHQHGQRLKAC